MKHQEVHLSVITLCGIVVGASLAYMTGVWVLSLALRNASVVDSFWGPGFVLISVVSIMASGAASWRSLLVLSLVALWGGRLCLYVTLRNRGRGEDWRYRTWREQAGPSFWWRSYIKVFILQGLLLVVVASPVLAVAFAPGLVEITAFDLAGIGLWTLGFLFEVIGDSQLARFKRDPNHRGKVFDRGLWRYTRHPNYFGESVLWWGVFLIAISVSHGGWSVIGPLTITYLLLRVSGVRMLERGLSETKPGYREYVSRTSPFFPWPPRRG
jgi:steroid 5-alpha reductase family enzyme